MPSITINGKVCEFKPGQMILQVANDQGLAIPQYCYHDGLSIVASCRICLAEVWAPNPRNGNKLESMGKLLPTCQTACTDGMVVYTDSPKAIANQKAVMEYLLINHPLDCPVCDQSGECFLQDYSYEYGRGVSRFEETKVKQPKKDLGPHVYLYSDRCIMCSRCVRFTREVSGTAELMVQGRGNTEQIDIFPGAALDNELSANVIDLCPVGALLDKDFLFTQRVWFLKETPSIDGITASGDNISIHHNNGVVYRVKPRTNMAVNKWWISDEIRYGWKFVHAENRLRTPTHVKLGRRVECDFSRAYAEAVEGLKGGASRGGLAMVVSPMLSCEEAYLLGKLARAIDPSATLAVGPVPMEGKDKAFPGGYTIYAEKAPNARGVRRALEAVAGRGVVGYEEFASRAGSFGAVVLTGNYPSEWVTAELAKSLQRAPSVSDGSSSAPFVVLIDTLPNRLSGKLGEAGGANVVIPGATWIEKGGTFENAKGMLQAFEQAIPVIELAKSEGQIALDLLSIVEGAAEVNAPDEMRLMEIPAMPGQVSGAARLAAPRVREFNAAEIRREMAGFSDSLRLFVTDVKMPVVEVKQVADVEVVEL
ncbi:MAG TPA: 2Fe-2S iron-sulfur cluster-binding protein [Phycisphaerales bacterium]|nr:2Fe-2S iron-sulfur cluster-binding protein [Phycisphaerales bacterium]